MITVLITVESRYMVDRSALKKRVETFLSGHVHRKTEVSVTIVGRRKMHVLNKSYRDIDKPTNVLSFALHEVKEGVEVPHFTTIHSSPDDTLRLGDVVVCYPIAIEEAAAQNKMVDVRIAELVEHGLNHLLGIHHD